MKGGHWSLFVGALTLGVGVFTATIVGSVFFNFYPNVECSRTEFSEDQTSDSPTQQLGQTEQVYFDVKWRDVRRLVKLKYAEQIFIQSVGWEPALDVQVKVEVKEPAVIALVGTDDTSLAKALPTIGKEGASRFAVAIGRMQPDRVVRLAFWYGIPDSPKTKPALPNVAVDHKDGTVRCMISK